ncbi:MAG: tRNA (adenine(22)-N(1))-methyltransferase [Erysipelotrichaceae bacterium]
MKLSIRLQAIADLIPVGKRVADIGTDHALLPCYLIQHNLASHVYACDLNQGPLDHAAMTITKYECQDSISLVLSNGLEKVDPTVEVIVIAGMGFETIKLILEGQIERFSNMETLIIQSNTDLADLRYWLNQNNFTIEAESLVEDGFYYHILKVKRGRQTLRDEQIRFGYQLEQNPLWVAELQRLQNHYSSILKNIPVDHPKYVIIQSDLEKIQSLLSQR